jgi:UDP-N-acetylglucosamine acyltransferase
MISSLSYIHPNAKIGHNVTVEPFAYIAEHVTIGDHSWIGPHACIMDMTDIGSHCKIFPGAVVGAIPQDLKYKGEASRVKIGDYVSIRECVTVNRGTEAAMLTAVGSHTLLMAYVHVAHDCFIGEHCVIANSVNLAGHIQIGNHVIVGGVTAVHQFVTIGDHAMIGGGSLVRKDVPPYVKAAREPLSYEGVNSIGLQRRGFTEADIHLIHDIYRVLFVKGLNIANAVTEIETTLPESKYKKEILDFIQISERGLMKGFK